MTQDQEAFLQVMCEFILAAARDGPVGEISVGHTPGCVIPGEYTNGWHTGHDSGYGPNPSTPMPAAEQFEDQDVNPVNSGWYDLVTPATCQGSSPLEDKQNNEWLCSGCHATFRSKYEARRHIDTAGMEVRCRYCDGVVNGAPYVLNRHIGSSVCLRKWKKRGFTAERTVDGAFRA